MGQVLFTLGTAHGILTAYGSFAPATTNIFCYLHSAATHCIASDRHVAPATILVVWCR